MVGVEGLAAQEFANQTIMLGGESLINPLVDSLKPVMGTISALVGGLFGLYLIFIIARLYYERKKVVLLKGIRFDLDYLNQHFNLPYSRERGIKHKIIPLKEFEKREKEKKIKELKKKRDKIKKTLAKKKK